MTDEERASLRFPVPLFGDFEDLVQRVWAALRMAGYDGNQCAFG
jgi:hypothetical protein